jgi:hypothetical protein
MNLTIRVSRNGETYDVTTNLFVTVLWERKYKARASDLATGVSMETLAFMAYEASRMNGITVPVVFDDFVKSVENLEVVDNEPGNPTQPAVTAGN